LDLIFIAHYAILILIGQMMNKKLFNKRPIVVFAASMLCFVYLFIYANNSVLDISLSVVAGCLLLVGIFISLFVKIDKFRYFFNRLAIISLAAIVAVSAISIAKANYNCDKIDEGSATITGRIKEVGEVYNEDRLDIILDNVNITSSTQNKQIKNCVRLVVLCDGAEEKLVVGTFVSISGKVSNYDLYYKNSAGEYTFYAINKGVTIYGYATNENVIVSSGETKLTIPEKIKITLQSRIEGALDDEYVGLALGMLFGDRSKLDDSISADFSSAGIAHILAVSGLHIGFLLAILIAICKILKIRGWPKFVFCSVVLVLYAWVCGFSVSVTRAVIMSITWLYGECRYKKYDSLNAWAIALSIVLVASPYSSTTVGFQLSFGAVLGVILLARPLTEFFSKFMFKKLALSLSATISVEIACTFIISRYFGEISLVAIIANFVAIPLASVAYMCLFITSIISLIIPAASGSIFLFQFVMQVVVKFVHLVAPASILFIKPVISTVVTGLTIAAMCVASDYLFIKRKRKLYIIGTLLVAIIALIII
jgi:ComEC/Rec2-related protein